MELIGVIFIYILSPLETFLKIGNAGTISKYLGVLVFAIFILRILKYNRPFIIPREGYYLIAFTVLGMVSSLWAVYPNISIARSITLIQLFVLYLITLNILKDKKNGLAKNIYNIIILFGVGISLYVIFQTIKMGSINQWTRVSISNNVDVNHLASFLIPSFLLSLNYAISRSYKHLIPALIIITAILLTQSRGAVVSLIIANSVYFFTSINREKMKIKAYYVLIAFFIILFIIKIIPGDFLYRVTSMFTDRAVLMSGSGRDVIWGWAWQEFTSKPIIGIGLGNFTTLYRPAHSSFFQIISELGLLGLGTISLFVFNLLRFKNNQRDYELKIERLVVIALLIMSLTVDIFYQKYLWIMMGIYTARKFNAKNEERVVGNKLVYVRKEIEI